MKKIIGFLAGLLAIAINQPLHAQPKENADQSLLWRITGKNLSKPSFLFGTIHMICEDDYLWTDKMKESLDKSEKVCFEMDLDDPAVMMQVASGLIDNSGKKLQDYFTPEQYKLVMHYFQDSLGMSLSMLQQMKPIGLQSFLTSRGSGCAHPTSYEETIMQTAQNSKKEILGLEDPKEQIAVLESIPTDSVIQQLMDEIQNKNNDDSEYSRLITAYKKQDLPALYNMITSSKELGDNMNAFLGDRNKKWIPRMQKSMAGSSVFFAVGAGHLLGKDGVISLLRTAGYNVEPIK